VREEAYLMSKGAVWPS